MKTITTVLLAVALLLGTTTALMAQKSKQLSVAEANALLERTTGEWQVDFSLWQAQNKQFVTSKGKASFSKQEQACFVREQFRITKPDGTIEEGEGFLSYSEANKRFEFVQIDNTGKSTLLLTGQWFPENKSLVLIPEKGFEKLGSQNGVLMHLQYTFFDDGTFMKAYRTPDTSGKYTLISQYHYKVKS